MHFRHQDRLLCNFFHKVHDIFTSCILLFEVSRVAAWNFMQAVRPLCRPCRVQAPLCSKWIRPTITLLIDVTAYVIRS